VYVVGLVKAMVTVFKVRVGRIGDGTHADGRRAGVAVGRGGLNGAGCGEAGWVRERDAQRPGGLSRRLNEVLIARRRGADRTMDNPLAVSGLAAVRPPSARRSRRWSDQ